MVNELCYFSADCTALPSVIETTRAVYLPNDGKLACFSFIDINAHKTTTAGEANIESKSKWQAASNYKSSAVSSA